MITWFLKEGADPPVYTQSCLGLVSRPTKTAVDLCAILLMKTLILWSRHAEVLVLTQSWSLKVLVLIQSWIMLLILEWLPLLSLFPFFWVFVAQSWLTTEQSIPGWVDFSSTNLLALSDRWVKWGSSWWSRPFQRSVSIICSVRWKLPSTHNKSLIVLILRLCWGLQPHF